MTHGQCHCSLHRKRRRGQATVEFVLVSLMLVLFLMLAWQMAWVAVQKWYFNYTAAYAARAWSVYSLSDQLTPQEVLLKAQGLARFYHPGIADMPLVSLMLAGSPDDLTGFPDSTNRFGSSDFPSGIRYRGRASYLDLFQPDVIESAGFEAGSGGSIYFATYIPIEHEESFSGGEDPLRFDNDRSN